MTRIPPHPCRSLDGHYLRGQQAPFTPDELAAENAERARRQHIWDLCDEHGSTYVLRVVHEWRRQKLGADQ